MDFGQFDNPNPLSIALRNSIMPGDTPPGMPQMPQMPKMGRGQMIMGIIADALAGAAGRPGPFAQAMQHRQDQESELAQWGLRRRGDLEDFERKQQIEARYRQPDVSPMERDVAAWQRMTPEQRAMYGQMQRDRQGDPDIFTTLPNGQFYAGPRSGLAAALTGGGTPPQRPAIGARIPLNGGPTQPASGDFQR